MTKVVATLLLALLLAAGCGHDDSAMDKAMRDASSAADDLGGAIAAERYDRVRVGWTAKRVERLFGTAHHDSPVIWDPAASECWVYSFRELPKPYTFCFDAASRLTMKQQGIDR